MDQSPPPSPDPEPTPDLARPPIWEERQSEWQRGAAHSQPAQSQPAQLGHRGPTFEPVPQPLGSTNTGGATGSGPFPPSPPDSLATSPGPSKPVAKRRRVGLALLALVAATGLFAAGFLLSRGTRSDGVVAASSSATEQQDQLEQEPQPSPESSAVSAPTATPEPPEPTAEPTPTAEAQNDANLDLGTSSLPGDDALEPVAQVAQAVAPAVVLIQHEAGQGSGIIYDHDGLILTNAHVVGGFENVSVQLASGIRVAGTVLGADENTDVAVVKIEPTEEFGVATLAPQSSVEVGQLAVAIGSPFGLDQTVTSGIVSAKDRVVGLVAMIQTDAPINPGNSGGALVDRQGRVIGMNTAIQTGADGGGNIGVGFAIPSDTAHLIADRILAGQSLDRGFLGVEGATPQLGDPGVVVTGVIEGTGAEAAGVQIDDLIVGFNGIEIRDMGDLAAAVRLQPPDAQVTVDILRGGQPLSIDVALGTYSEPNALDE